MIDLFLAVALSWEIQPAVFAAALDVAAVVLESRRLPSGAASVATGLLFQLNRIGMTT
jgi:hypothetical protein